MLNKEQISTLAQLFESLDDAVRKLEEFYLKGDIKNYKKIQGEILIFHKEISKILR